MFHDRLPRISAAWLPLLLLAALTVVRSGAADEPVRPVQYDPSRYPPGNAPGSMMLLGGATTAAWYSLALGGGLIWPNSPGGNDLRIPVAGPWMALADTGCADDEPKCARWWVITRAILIGIDGIGQAGGLAVMLEGAFMPTHSGARPARAARATQERWSVIPVPLVTGHDGLGLGLAGHF